MLSALLATVQSSLALSRSFVIGSFFPVLAFAVATFAMLYQVSGPVRGRIAALEQRSQQGVYAGAVALGLVALGYVFSTLSGFLREVLEGKRLGRLRAPLCAGQSRELKELETRIRGLDVDASGLSKERRGEWEKKLTDAFTTGKITVRTCAALDRAFRQQLDALIGLREGGEFVNAKDLDDAVTVLVERLGANNAALDTPEAKELAAAQDDLQSCIDYAASKYEFERIRVFNVRQFRYPGTFSDAKPVAAVNVLAATRMGNIAQTVRSYALTRYQMDLDIFYTRLQKILQSQPAFFGGIQDAKIQVDFLIALCWLTGLFTLVWTIVLPFVSDSYCLFLGTVILGPVLTRLWYNLACQAYVPLADLLRSSVDLFRFELLKDLRVPPPYGTEEEKQLWSNLNQWIGYDQGKPFTYKHPS